MLLGGEQSRSKNLPAVTMDDIDFNNGPSTLHGWKWNPPRYDDIGWDETQFDQWLSCSSLMADEAPMEFPKDPQIVYPQWEAFKAIGMDEELGDSHVLDDCPITVPSGNQTVDPRQGVFDLFDDDDELEDIPPSAVSEILFSLPEASELGSLLPTYSDSGLEEVASPRIPIDESQRHSNHITGGKGFRIPIKAKVILESWLEAHLDDPYLKDGDADALAHLTGLTAQQVKNFVANTRLRRPGTSGGVSRNSSGTSLPSLASSSSLAPRKGRRRYYRASATRCSPGMPEIPARDPYKPYQCTFCYQPFSRKSDWKRHEQSSHFPQEEWVCMPEYPIFRTEIGTFRCAFCEQLGPDEHHLQEAHRYETCINKPDDQRTFTRKDKLQQHLSQVHNQARLTEYQAAAWTRPVNRNFQFSCGFCNEWLSTWILRTEHIASHFENGSDMSSWQGTLGGVNGQTSDFPESLPQQANALDWERSDMMEMI